MKTLTTMRRFLPLFIRVLLVIVIGVQVALSQISEASTLSMTDNPQIEASECRLGDGWMWTYGSMRPEIANQAQQTLDSFYGIDANVTERDFGETDSCGNFRLYAVDFLITLLDPQIVTTTEQQEIVEQIHPILTEYGKPNLGNIQITFLPSKEVFTIRPDAATFDNSKSREIKNQPSALGRKNASGLLTDTWKYVNASSRQIFLPLVMRAYTPSETITRKVYVIVYDPILSNTQSLSDYLNWNEHTDLTQGTVDFFRQATDNSLNYEIVDTTIVTDGWPEKIDGFRYTEAEYLAAIRGEAPFHTPDAVDYNKIVNSAVFDICGRANRGEIDEVWIYNGPGFGFYESTLVGPNAYWYNSPPVPGQHTCNRLIPIMGPNPERGLDCTVENFGHRTESTMVQVYGSWQQNRTAHNWEKFSLVKALSPDYSYSGCGNVHYPPNGVADYNYGNTATVLSNCDEFANYPNLGNPLDTAIPVTCSRWNCDHLDYFGFWFGHLPSNSGCGADGVANNWWKYFSTPALALDPSLPCQ